MRVGLLVAVVALGSALLLPGAAGAAPIGKDGKVHACYKAKGKARGQVRLARSAKARCPKGWKKISWPANTATGQAGAPGSPGAPGQSGSPGQVSTSVLETQVSSLLSRLDGLEKTIGELKGTIGGLEGKLGDLEGVVGGLAGSLALLEPTVTALCGQAEALTGQSNALSGVLEGLELLGVVGGLLVVPALPEALPDFTCPTS